MIKHISSLRLFSGSLLLLSLCALPLHGQSASAPGGATSSSGGTTAPDLLSYSITASNSLIFGYSGVNGPSDTINISGNAGYVSGSEHHPTSFVYSGGYLFGNNGQPSSSFQSLGVSQVLNTRQWTFIVGDVISYLPSTPRFGLAGVPGVGDIGSLPIASGQQIGDALLTNYGQRVTNTVNGSADYRFTARTNVSAFGGYTIQRFLGNSGLNSNLFNGGAQVQHNLTAATTVGVGYTYVHSTYPSFSNLGFNSHALLGIYQHTFSPRLSLQASAGPQWTSGTNSTFFPSRLGVAANVGVTYLAGRNNYSLNYARGTSTGSGVLLGSTSDYLNFAGQRRFSENWNAGVFAGYGHAQSLSNDPALYTNSNSFSAGLQGNRRLSEHFSVYGSYSLQYQAVGQLLAANNAFNGTAHVISFGVTYAPRPIHLGRR